MAALHEHRTLLKRPLTWERLADGRVWRLKAGKHFPFGDLQPLRQEATEAAARLGKAVLMLSDDLGKWLYLWVQFADFEATAHMPCPACGGALVSLHPNFGRCESCRRTAILREDKAAARVAAAPNRDLSRYSELHLRFSARLPGREQHVGWGVAPAGVRMLLQVDFFLDADGERLPNPLRPGDFLYRVRALPAEPFEGVLDFDAFAATAVTETPAPRTDGDAGAA